MGIFTEYAQKKTKALNNENFSCAPAECTANSNIMFLGGNPTERIVTLNLPCLHAEGVEPKEVDMMHEFRARRIINPQTHK